MGEPGFAALVAIFIFAVLAAALGVFLILLGRVVNPTRPNPVKNMPYESGMDPIHGARRRFDVRFHLVAIAFLIFDVELLFLYPWGVLWANSRPQVSAPSGSTGLYLSQAEAFPSATAFPQNDETMSVSMESAEGKRIVPARQSNVRDQFSPFAFGGGLLFFLLLVVGFIFDWRKGVFSWR